jgi:hypothetical protein
MLKGAEPIEVVTLLATLTDLFFDNRRSRGGQQVVSGESTRVSVWAQLAERIINELGIGVRDEGLFPLKLGKLSDEDRKVIEEVITVHDKRTVNRLRIITINVPNPPPTKVKGKKERKENGKVVEAAEPDKEIPSDIDNGVKFLESIIPSLRGKTKEEQVRVLENFNLVPKSSFFIYEASKNIVMKTAKILGFPDDATFEQVLERLRALLVQIRTPDPTQPRPNDKAGWFVRFMRSITPGSYPNPK